MLLKWNLIIQQCNHILKIKKGVLKETHLHMYIQCMNIFLGTEHKTNDQDFQRWNMWRDPRATAFIAGNISNIIARWYGMSSIICDSWFIPRNHMSTYWRAMPRCSSTEPQYIGSPTTLNGKDVTFSSIKIPK